MVEDAESAFLLAMAIRAIGNKVVVRNESRTGRYLVRARNKLRGQSHARMRTPRKERCCRYSDFPESLGPNAYAFIPNGKGALGLEAVVERTCKGCV
jgi:hypothetical protein